MRGSPSVRGEARNRSNGRRSGGNRRGGVQMAKESDETTRRTVLAAAVVLTAIAMAGSGEARGEGAPAGEPAVDVSRMPRIEPLTYAQADEKTRKAWDKLRPPPDSPTRQPGVEPEIFRVRMHHPELAQ